MVIITQLAGMPMTMIKEYTTAKATSWSGKEIELLSKSTVLLMPWNSLKRNDSEKTLPQIR